MNDHTFQYTSPHKDHPQLLIPWEINNTIGRFLIAWFNECVLGKSGQIANPIIAMVDPVLYAYVNLLIIAHAGTGKITSCGPKKCNTYS